MTDLISAVVDALDGSISVDGETVTVYMRGHEEDAVPCVMVERPEGDGRGQMDGSSHQMVRLDIRVHDRKGNLHAGKPFYALRPQTIANEVESVLSSGVTASGTEIRFLKPDHDPLPSYEAEGQSAYDHLLRYQLLLP